PSAVGLEDLRDAVTQDFTTRRHRDQGAGQGADVATRCGRELPDEVDDRIARVLTLELLLVVRALVVRAFALLVDTFVVPLLIVVAVPLVVAVSLGRGRVVERVAAATGTACAGPCRPAGLGAGARPAGLGQIRH